MVQVREIERIDDLVHLRPEWGTLLAETAGASFFQSLDWLEIYWRHFGHGQKLRVLVVEDAGRTTGILPLVVRVESSRVGRLRVLTFPLHNWGSFYGPIGPDPYATFTAGIEHVRSRPRDWDLLELRWQGAADTDPMIAGRALQAVGCRAYATVWDQTAVVDLDTSWDAYWSSRKGAWLRRFRRAEHKLAECGEVSWVHYRPHGQATDDASPRWDLYDACEAIARRSWQGSATDGTTLSHETVRSFLRDMHETAAATGALDMHLLSIDGEPTAFIYGYHYRGHVDGLRRGYDAGRSREGAGNVLLAYALRECFARGDRLYDMGAGSVETKRHFLTRTLPILRFSHFPPLAMRTQALRLARWWQGRRLPASIAVGRAHDRTADSR